MRKLIQTVSLRHLRLNPLRTLLTCIGIMLGTAISVGVGMMNESTLASFGEMVDGVAGKSDLSVTSVGRGGMSAEVLDRILALPGVKTAAPTVRVPAFLSDHPAETLLVLGIDALAGKDFQALKGSHEPAFDPVAFLNTPDSVLVPKSLAERNGIHKDERLWVTLHGKKIGMTVRAIVAEEGAAKVYGGNVLIVDLFAAEELLGRGGRIDQIDVLAKPELPREQLEARVKAALGEGFVVEQSARNKQAQQLVESLRRSVDMMSGLAIFVGMFLIYNTFATSVAQRRKEIGVLRALGTTQAQIIGVFLFEALLAGVVGSALGVLAGTGIAKGLITQYAKTIDSLYFRVHTDTIVFSGAIFVRSILIGVTAAVAAAVVPAWQAARVRPVEALSRTQSETTNRRGFKVLFAVGLAALIIETVFLVRGSASTDAATGVMAATLAFVSLTLLSPWLITVACAALHPLLRRLPGIEPRLGGDNLTRNLGRTAVTVTALMIGITLAVAMSGSFGSIAKSFDEWIKSSLAIDLSIRGSAAMPGANSIELPPDAAAEVAAVPGIADVGIFRMTPVETAAGTVQLISINVEPFSRHAAFSWTEGDPAKGYADLLDGKHVMLSENLAARRNLHLGDSIEIGVPGGRRAFTVAGVIVDYTSDLGTVILNRKTYLELFNDPYADALDVWVTPGLDPNVVRERVRQALPERQFFIQTNTEFRGEVNKAVGQLFGLTDLVQVLVLIIAVIGILNTMLISILDRTRELGMLRAVGFTREQLKRLILWEAALLGVVAGILGTASGAGFSMFISPLVQRQLLGWTMTGVFPAQGVALGFGVAVISALLAGIYPARKAAKLTILDALAWE
jgi:putative ABC transport system permease protein